MSYILENIYYLRIKNKLTQREMAEIIGISVSTLRRMEKFDKSVRTHSGMIHRICDRFEITADELLLVPMD